MKISIMSPSPLEAKELTKDIYALASVQPIQYQRGQRVIYVLPVVAYNDAGKVLDRAFLTVNTRTGKMGLEHRNEEVLMPVDEPEPIEVKPAPKTELKKVVNEQKQTS